MTRKVYHHLLTFRGYHHLLTLRVYHYLLTCAWTVGPAAPKQQLQRRDPGPRCCAVAQPLPPNGQGPQETDLTCGAAQQKLAGPEAGY